MEIRLTFPNKVDAIMQVIEDAKKTLALSLVTSSKMAIQMLTSLLMISLWSSLCGLGRGELLAYAAVTKSPERAYEAIHEGSYRG